jgi:glycosyltransferase involved in cell wall biosynthesis
MNNLSDQQSVKSQPLISVLMTAFNREQYIDEAIQSVINSSYSNWELIIVDDCSSDKTVQIATSYADLDNRIQLYCNKINLGDYPNRNYAATLAKGKYIKYLDSDDKLYPWSIKYCVNEMEKFPDVGMGILLLNSHTYNGSLYLNKHETQKMNWLQRPILSIGPTGAIYNREIFNKTGGFQVKYKVASDAYFHNIMASFAPIILLPKDFFYYRIHEGQEMNKTDEYLIQNYLYRRDLIFNKKLCLSDWDYKKVKLNFFKIYLRKLISSVFTLKTMEVKKLMQLFLTKKHEEIN